MPTIETRDGTEIYYKDWGSGRPVVLIHGWPLHADMWEYQMTAMAAQGLRCIAPDRRGFGRSAHPWSGYDYDTLADDVATLIDSLDLRDIVLVGFSMGGGEVARYLSRHGSTRIARAVLVGSVLPFLLKTRDNPGGVEPVGAGDERDHDPAVGGEDERLDDLGDLATDGPRGILRGPRPRGEAPDLDPEAALGGGAGHPLDVAVVGSGGLGGVGIGHGRMMPRVLGSSRQLKSDRGAREALRVRETADPRT